MRPLLFALSALCATGVLGTSAACAQDVSAKSADVKKPREGFAIPGAWARRGVVLERQRSDGGVSGDPCIVWDEATLADYNRDPKAKVPGTKMVFNGVKNAGQLADLVAYLKQATQ